MGLLIKNGTILTPDGEYVGDILVEGEQIAELGVNLPEEGHEVVDATGKYVFPGGVDEHVHMGPFDTYGFETSHAAVVGGTTTVIDFSPQYEGMGVIESMEKHRDENAVGKSTADFSFHGMVMNNSEDVLDEIPKMVDAGISTLKLFMAYKYTPFMVEDSLIYKAMQIARDHGITIMVHAENGDLVYDLQQQLVKEGKLESKYHADSRPPIVEDEATERAIQLAKLADCPLFVVHVSTEGATKAIKEAYEAGYPIYGETCTHYLTLDESYLGLPDFEGAKYVCAPSLRKQKHLDALWTAIRNDDLKAVSSDHAAVIGGFETKKKGLERFDHIPPGCPSFQERLAMLWTQGVEKGRITKERFIEIFTAQPAKLIGAYPKKGALLPGSDADIVIFNPEFEGTITHADSYEGSDYTAFEGFEKKGIAEKVYLRGKLMAENGKFVGEKGGGQYIKPKPYAYPYEYFNKRTKSITEVE